MNEYLGNSQPTERTRTHCTGYGDGGSAVYVNCRESKSGGGYAEVFRQAGAVIVMERHYDSCMEDRGYIEDSGSKSSFDMNLFSSNESSPTGIEDCYFEDGSVKKITYPECYESGGSLYEYEYQNNKKVNEAITNILMVSAQKKKIEEMEASNIEVIRRGVGATLDPDEKVLEVCANPNRINDYDAADFAGGHVYEYECTNGFLKAKVRCFTDGVSGCYIDGPESDQGLI